MALWSFFFISKVILHYRGHLQFDGFLNVLMGLYAILPWAASRSVGLSIRKNSGITTLHGGFGLALGVMLLWHDSYFPPVRSLYHYLSDPVTRPSNDFLFQFVMNYWNPFVFAVLVAIYWICRVSAKKWNLAPAVALVVAATTAHGALTRKTVRTDLALPSSSISGFGSGVLSLESPGKKDAPFDVLILQVCSLSAEDLAHTGMSGHSFFEGFDLRFSNFNTATSYSTPAALRLLQALCGQARHEGLFQGVPAACMLLEGLRSAGYRTSTVFNHEGKLSNKMANELVTYAKADLPMPISGLSQKEVSYDKSPVYGNFDVLEQWWKQRLTSSDPRVALYYNTVSLHVGNHLAHDSRPWWKQEKSATYRELLEKTLSDFDRFFRLLEESNRDVLVIMVSEHGAALAGSEIQGPDLRDIPLPKLTLVPMGVKLIGSGWKKSAPVRIEDLVSYSVIPRVINLATKHHSRGDSFSVDEFSGVSEARFFAENADAATLIRDQELFYQGKDRVWKSLPAQHIPESLKTALQSRSP
jgi:cellulose synthase operon protein YhjU